MHPPAGAVAAGAVATPPLAASAASVDGDGAAQDGVAQGGVGAVQAGAVRAGVGVGLVSPDGVGVVQDGVGVAQGGDGVDGDGDGEVSPSQGFQSRIAAGGGCRPAGARRESGFAERMTWRSWLRPANFAEVARCKQSLRMAPPCAIVNPF